MLLQAVHDQHHEQVGRLAGAQVRREMLLDLILLAATVRRIHQHHIKLVIIGIVKHITSQGIAMHHHGGIYVVKEQVGDAKHVGELLLLDTIDRLRVGFLVLGSGDLFIKCIEPAGDEATRTTSEVSHLFTHLRINNLGHEVGQSTRCIELTCRACRLHFFQDGLVYFTKGVALLVITQIQLVNDIDYLTKQHAILHVLIGIFKGCTHDCTAHGRFGSDLQVL